MDGYLPHAKPGVTHRQFMPYYMCKYCFKPFGNPNGGNYHEKSAHEATVGKCATCGKSPLIHQKYCAERAEIDPKS